jgi:AcrR family transcriptional regulator
MRSENSPSKSRKKRRTKKEIDDAIWTTARRLITQNGFNNITLTGLAKEAGVTPIVIYNRFSNLDDLFEKYTKRYMRECDYWLNDLARIDLNKTPKENFKNIVTNLVKELYDNEVMQKVLLWEMNDTNKITRKMAQRRETDSDYLLNYFNSSLGNKKINFNMLLSMLTAGIYYLILHRKISTFSTIDFNTKQAKDDLMETIEKMIDFIYEE